MYYADFHIHSRFSRATSKSLDLPSLALWAQIKGIRVIGTGDCLHPGWLKELKTMLEPAEEGLFRLKKDYAKWSDVELPAACRGDVRFLLTTEIANIYKKNDKVRKIHNVLFFPGFDSAQEVRAKLEKIGNLHSDGRPILGLDSEKLLEMTIESDPLSFLVPAHIWTPWFSALGSKGGFDSIDECYGSLTEYIFAVETGLSSDPIMNWRLSQLDRFVMMSNSDAHSAPKIGREATVFETELSYPAMFQAMKDPKDKGLIGTIEFFPEEGKYHYDGHRACDCRLHPKETIAKKGLCPVCGRPVTVGVMARVEELADHPEGRKSPRWRPYYSLVPLPEIIAEARGCGVNTKAVNSVYFEILASLGNELSILRDIPLKEIEKTAGALITEGVRRVRDGELQIAAGYDGEYGTVSIFSEEERLVSNDQLKLF